MRIWRNDLQRGITVLELLVVLVIVSVISLVAVSRYMRVKDKAVVAAAEADVSTLRKAMAMYAADYDSYPPKLRSMQDLAECAVDPKGFPYVDIPGKPNFSWVSYKQDPNSGYVLTVQANNGKKTQIQATPDGLVIAGKRNKLSK